MDTNLTYENARAGMVLDSNHTGIVIVHSYDIDGLYRKLLSYQ